ncbi:hypothetical protein T484DRAFT_1771709 [Baffinella frigidus]|nr:hypothetical protein T484DRAFT_1771709 [Cryptophyta sp. CCMP2293]
MEDFMGALPAYHSAAAEFFPPRMSGGGERVSRWRTSWARCPPTTQQQNSRGFAMEDFMGALPAYFEGPGAQKEETARAVTMLLEISDFTDFKNMMLYAKRQKEEATEAPSADAKGQGEMNVLSLEATGAPLADAKGKGEMNVLSLEDVKG